MKGRKKRRPFTRERVAKWLQGRFFLRFHMTLILAATFLAGLGATKLLLVLGMASLALRYVLAVCAAYLAFLALIRLWLIYVGVDRSIDLSGDGLELLDIRIGDFGGEVAGSALETGGGSFGGAGATGSWDEAATVPVRAVAAPVKSSSGGIGDLFDFDADGGCAVVLLFLALIGALFVAGAYVIYTAPALLAEAAFEALLTAALVRRAKKIDRPGWVGTVWRATVWPFIAVVILAGALGWAAQDYCPEATRLSDVFDCPSGNHRHVVRGNE